MRGCCLTNLIVLGVTDGGGEPPILSDYCVQWGTIPVTIFFPCGENSEVNGNFSQPELCGTVGFSILDFQGVIGNTFFYVNEDQSISYAHVIRPIANAALPDLGTYSFEIFGNPSGPQPIVITNENCFVQCFTATFDVNDVNIDGFTQIEFNGITRDLAPTPFSDPDHDADVLAQLLVYFEPSVTFVSSFVGNTVTVTITSIMDVEVGYAGEAGDVVQFNFVPC